MRIILNYFSGTSTLKALKRIFCSNGKAKEILDILIKIANERGLDSTEIRGAIEADPLEPVNAEWNSLYP